MGANAHLTACLSALIASILLVQVAAQQLAAQEQAPPPAPSEPDARGIFESIGRWFDQGTAGFRSHVLGARDSFGHLNEQATATTRSLGETAADVTKEAVGAVAKLPLVRVVSGRELCPLAANGAPDCLVAADNLCRKQGFSSGKSIDFTSAERCSPKVLLSGRQSDADCKTVTFVGRAMCQ